MTSKILGLLATGLLVAPLHAFAVPVDYKITFKANVGGDFNSAGVAPTSGSFTYDSDGAGFSNFFVTWNGIVFDLTRVIPGLTLGANAPFKNGDACGFAPLEGPALMFALLSSPGSSTCPSTAWAGLSATADGEQFGFYTSNLNTPEAGRLVLLRGFAEPSGADALFSDGSWRISPVGVPEPTSLALLTLGLAGMGFVGRRKSN